MLAAVRTSETSAYFETTWLSSTYSPPFEPQISRMKACCVARCWATFPLAHIQQILLIAYNNNSDFLEITETHIYRIRINCIRLFLSGEYWDGRMPKKYSGPEAVRVLKPIEED
jgi:hypothetical protein